MKESMMNERITPPSFSPVDMSPNPRAERSPQEKKKKSQLEQAKEEKIQELEPNT